MSDDQNVHVHIHFHGLDGLASAALDAIRLLREIFNKLENLERQMSQMDDDIAALQASVTQENTVIDSAVALLNGISAQIQAAVDAALAAGATTQQLQAMTDLKNAVDTKQAELAQAVTLNTPNNPTPQPTPTPNPLGPVTS